VIKLTFQKSTQSVLDAFDGWMYFL